MKIRELETLFFKPRPRTCRRGVQPNFRELTVAIKGSRGSHVSFHDGDKGSRIVVATGENPVDLATDLLEIGRDRAGGASKIIPKADISRGSDGRISAGGVGGNDKEVIGAMVDALFQMPAAQPS